MPLYDTERHLVYLTPTEGDLIGIFSPDAESRRFTCSALPDLELGVNRSTRWAQRRLEETSPQYRLKAKEEVERLQFMCQAIAWIIALDEQHH